MNLQTQAEQKMIQMADDFSLVAGYLKEQLSLGAFHFDEEHFKANKIKYDYLTELCNVMGNLKEELNNDE
ncbi:hypothetical protein AB4342_01350 [Vibrio breoganii]